MSSAADARSAAVRWSERLGDKALTPEQVTIRLTRYRRLAQPGPLPRARSGPTYRPEHQLPAPTTKARRNPHLLEGSEDLVGRYVGDLLGVSRRQLEASRRAARLRTDAGV